MSSMDELWHKWRWRRLEEEARADEEKWAEWVSLYRPLEESEIRLLILDPVQSNDTTLKCRLSRVPLSKAPPYVALSYHWGNLDATTDVEVNKTRLPITVNLNAALVRLRAEGVDTVWADALCINQNDRKEKSLQIPRIDTIFRKAVEVAVWTGNEKDIDENAALSLAAGIAPTLKPGQCLSSLPFFNDFLARPYWARVWIIQELAVASEIYVYYDRFRIPWRAIDIACDCCQDLTNSGVHPANRNVYRFAMLRKVRTDITSRQPIRLLEALQRTMFSLATDPRDKIFALLGLTFDWKSFIPEPSYVTFMPDIFTTFATALLVGKEPLDLIYLRSANRKLDHVLPSWVPDWTDLHDAVAYRQFNYIMSRSSSQRNSADKVHKYELDISGPCLNVKGVIFDTVFALGSSLNMADEDAFSYGTSWTKGPSLPYKADEIPGIINRTLFSSELFSNSSQQSFCNIPDGFSHRWRIRDKDQIMSANPEISSKQLAGSICAWLEENRSFVVNGRSLEWWTKVTLDHPRINNDGFPSSIDARLLSAIQSQMRLLMTDEGYFGWAHPQAVRGDKVAVILGCSRPVIIRACQGGYQIIGDAYIPGQSVESLRERTGNDIESLVLL